MAKNSNRLAARRRKEQADNKRHKQEQTAEEARQQVWQNRVQAYADAKGFSYGEAEARLLVAKRLQQQAA